MGYNLRIVFSGLCAFVPDRNFSSAEPAREVTVLLRNLFKPIVFSNGTVMAPHIPRLEVDPKHVRAWSNRKADYREDPDTSEARHLYILRFEDIRFRPGSTETGSLEVVAHAPTRDGEQNPTEAEARSLFFLLNIREAAGSQATVKTPLLGELFADERQPLLAARVFITSGRLSTDKLQDGLWQLGQQGKPKKLARSIVLEFGPLEADSEILFREFDQPETTTTKLVLGPTVEDRKERGEEEKEEAIEIRIKNAEIERMMEHLGQRVVVEDLDVEAYFDLCTLTSTQLVPREANRTVIGPGGCSPVAIPSA